MIPPKIVLTIILFLMLSCDSNDPYRGQYASLSFEEKLTIGQPDSLSKSTLHFTRDIRIGPNKNIYAADAAETEIKVYSPDGELINRFGKRGRGPGELTDIKGFAVTDSTVLVWDQNTQRISIFGLDGKFHRARNLKGLASSMRIHPLKNSYLALHIDGHYGDQIKKTRLGHLYSTDFSTQKANFIKLQNIDEKIEGMSHFLRSWTGYILVRNNQNVLFVPRLYNGNIYQYSRTAEGWQQTNKFNGLNQQSPYTLVEDKQGRNPDGAVSALGSSEKKQFIAHNLSRGLLEYNDFIFHFTFSDIKDKRVFGVEIYDQNVKPIGYVPIKSIPITEKDRNFLSWFAEDVDENGNFYIIQRNDRGTRIRVLSLKESDWETLRELSS